MNSGTIGFINLNSYFEQTLQVTTLPLLLRRLNSIKTPKLAASFLQVLLLLLLDNNIFFKVDNNNRNYLKQ
jgi:hypothetical protein